jgi:hypothetical protein
MTVLINAGSAESSLCQDLHTLSTVLSACAHVAHTSASLTLLLLSLTLSLARSLARSLSLSLCNKERGGGKREIERESAREREGEREREREGEREGGREREQEREGIIQYEKYKTTQYKIYIWRHHSTLKATPATPARPHA